MSCQFDYLFQQEVEQHDEIMLRYLKLTTENFATAFKLAQKSLSLSDRWNDIAADAKKVATAHGLNKTDIQKWAYGKYRNMHLAHEHCRSIWRSGEDFNRQMQLRGIANMV